MKPEEMDRVIAEHLGWELVPLDGREFDGIPVMVWKRPDGERGFPIPCYSADMNAMHEVEKSIKDFDCYVREIQILTSQWDGLDDPGWLFRLIRATATQRAQAFLRTVGKWRIE